jgi:hypothetical protein
MIALDQVGQHRGRAPISGMAAGLLEDICGYVIKKTMDNAALMMDRRSTVTIEILRSALRMEIRTPQVFEGIDKVGMAWVNHWGSQRAAARATGNSKNRVHTGGKHSIMPGRMSANRVRNAMRRARAGCTRMSFQNGIYMAGVLNEIVAQFIGETNTGEFAKKAPKRLSINDFYSETKENLNLSAIIPHTMIMRFGADKHPMTRKRTRRSSESSRPSKRQRRNKSGKW